MDIVADRDKFLALGGHIDEMRPCETDAVKHYGDDPHYLFMGGWAFKKIVDAGPRLHVDIGGDVRFINYLRQLVPVEQRDIRSCLAPCQNYRFIRDDITNLSIPDCSVESLSCLHVAEHIGLGRYGDEVNPDGFVVACGELNRILAHGGRLYFAVPVGAARVVFNAHRVISGLAVISAFNRLKLESCAFCDGAGHFHEHYDPSDLDGDAYGCGMFEFSKPRRPNHV